MNLKLSTADKYSEIGNLIVSDELIQNPKNRPSLQIPQFLSTNKPYEATSIIFKNLVPKWSENFNLPGKF